MDNLDKLEKKVAEKFNEVKEVSVEPRELSLTILENKLDKLYRIINNCDKRIERKLDYIEKNQNVILKALEHKGDVNIEEIKRQEEIKALEQKLNELKKGV